MRHEESLETLLAHRVSEGRKLLVPYVTAGLPSPQRFVELISNLAPLSDAIEVGIPFSDPIMDGPVIQEASTRALDSGVTVQASFTMIREALRHAWVPLVVMTYYNPIHKMGEDFLESLTRSGTEGIIVPDLPYEEAGDLDAALLQRKIALIQMVGPTTSAPRAAILAKASRGFVYAVSRLGVTGERESLDEAARPVVERVRPHTSLPILLGIGISTPDHARQAASVADGVIVGSAIMKKILANDLAGVTVLCKQIRAALDEER